ncbi:MAG TPA: hypothetical protein VKR31_04565 [Rhizomicrobium sp.]|nr:hypothetical protein [Rhizomicrobium sp.]
MGWASTVYYRAWQDVFMGSRLAGYSALLMRLKQLGYRFCTMAEFLAAETNERSASPVCLLRNDVDSDPGGAARMFDCDRAAGARGTYYFRLSTLDPALAARIAASGGEVGYHFEEIATVAKRIGLRSESEITARIELFRDEFRKNVAIFRERCGVPLRTVASHGDFANRRIGVPNQQLLTQALLDELGIVADAYDSRIHGGLAARFTDCPPPQWWKPDDPMRALEQRPATVSILVHPRQWICNPAANLRLTVRRVTEEVVWRLRGALHTSNRCAPQSAIR